MPTTLTPGDIAIIGYITNGTPADSFSFVSFVDIEAGTTLYFTDNGWSNSIGFRGVTSSNGTGNENLIKFTASATIAKGSVIRSTDSSPNFTWTNSGAIGAGGNYANLALNQGGEQLSALQSTNSSNPLYFDTTTNPPHPYFTAIHQVDNTNAFEDAVAGGSTGNVIPGLSQTNDTAVLLNNTASHAVFNLNTLPMGGTKEEWLAAIKNPVNWTFNTTAPLQSETSIQVGSAGGGGGGSLIVTNTNNSGAGSLRSAIDYANSIGGGTITFEIPANDPGFDPISGQFVINLTAALPVLTKAIVIDGYSQAGATANTLAIGNNAVLKIVLDGSNAGSANGLQLSDSANNSTIRGLEIRDFQKEGILVLGDGNTIRGNFILSNGDDGIQLGDGQSNGSSTNRIGGAIVGDRNVISGNGDDGIDVKSGSTNNQVLGNYIGTNLNGTAAAGNLGNGVQIDDSANNAIGGTNAGDRNVISGNGEHGVLILQDGAVENQVIGNYIGTNASGGDDLGNAQFGVGVAGASNNTIGGTEAGTGNVIAGNGAAGVAIANVVIGGFTNIPAHGNSVLGNTIHGNDGLGIDLGQASTNNGVDIVFSSTGVTPNDPGDADSGANELQNFPVLSNLELTSSKTANVTVSLNSNPNATFQIEFFANRSLDESGHGEGQIFLDSRQVTTDATGNLSLNVSLSGVARGLFITATATRVENSDYQATSEFSQAIQIAPARNDFDRNKTADILWRNPTTGTNYLQQRNGTTALNDTFHHVDAAMVVEAVDDFNGDGKADVLWRNRTTGTNRLQQRDGATILSDTFHHVDAAMVVEAVDDFNGDGKADVLWRNRTTGTNRLQQRDGATILSDTFHHVSAAMVVEAVDDFNGDGNADILWRNRTTGTNRLQQRDGATILSDTYYHVDAAMVVEAVDDFNGDGNADILWRDRTTGTNRLQEMNGGTVLRNTYIRHVSANMIVGAVDDFNGDGNADILWRNQSTGYNRLQEMNGATVLRDTVIRHVDAAMMVGAVDDFNGDGKADILWRNQSTGYNRLFEMNGATIIQDSALPAVNSSFELISI